MGWLAKFSSFMEERRLRLSFAKPHVRCYRRDAFRYYENGRWVTVDGELLSGRNGVDRLIYRRSPLKWNDAGDILTKEDQEKVLKAVGEYLDRSGSTWKSSDA
jgi:hypothetical protein